MKKIVVLEKKTLGNLEFSLLNKFGDVKLYDTTTEANVVERIKDADIILVNKVVLNEDNLKYAKNLELICEVATGYNNIDIEYCKKNNIAVTNVAGYSTPTVAQHTFALLLSLYNKVNYYDNFVKSKEYTKSGLFTCLNKPFNDVEGKTWGIVGLGAIGRKVAEIATAFGANVVYYSTSGKNNNHDYRKVELEELLKESDIISIHAPLNDKTNNLMNYNNLCKMKKSAVLINVGRGPIVNDSDLARALDEGVIAGAGLDVFTIEPVKEDNPLLNLKNEDRIVLSPHIAWASEEARKRLFDSVIKNIESFYNNGERNRVDN